MHLHEVVALTEDMPESGLLRGQVGTIVEEWEPGVYEVEFADLDGRAYAFAAVSAERLMPLHWSTAQAA